jgi:hypothetical protein
VGLLENVREINRNQVSDSTQQSVELTRGVHQRRGKTKANCMTVTMRQLLHFSVPYVRNSGRLGFREHHLGCALASCALHKAAPSFSATILTCGSLNMQESKFTRLRASKGPDSTWNQDSSPRQRRNQPNILPGVGRLATRCGFNGHAHAVTCCGVPVHPPSRQSGGVVSIWINPTMNARPTISTPISARGRPTMKLLLSVPSFECN